MTPPRVSALITCYNAAWCIERSLDSVFAQSRPADQVIVSDDGSTDDTVAIITRRYGDRVRLLRLPHRGLTPSRKAAIDAAGGDWFALLDADDAWLPGKLERQTAAIARFPRARWIGTDARLVTDTEVLRESYLSDYFDPVRELAGDLLPALIERSFVLPTTVLIEAAAYGEAGGFDPAIVYSQDYDLFLRLAARFEGVVLAEPLALYYSHPGQISRRYEERHRDDYALMQRVEAGTLRADPALRATGARRVADLAWKLGVAALRAGRMDEARGYLRRAAGVGSVPRRRTLARAARMLPAPLIRMLARSRALKRVVAEAQPPAVRIDSGSG
jgi:glycosyltransferase involved in cell wall biosynthesis